MALRKNISDISDGMKQKIIREFLSTKQGRVRLAASMVAPLRGQRDYGLEVAFGEKCLSGNFSKKELAVIHETELFEIQIDFEMGGK